MGAASGVPRGGRKPLLKGSCGTASRALSVRSARGGQMPPDWPAAARAPAYPSPDLLSAGARALSISSRAAAGRRQPEGLRLGRAPPHGGRAPPSACPPLALSRAARAREPGPSAQAVGSRRPRPHPARGQKRRRRRKTRARACPAACRGRAPGAPRPAPAPPPLPPAWGARLRRRGAAERLVAGLGFLLSGRQLGPGGPRPRCRSPSLPFAARPARSCHSRRRG